MKRRIEPDDNQGRAKRQSTGAPSEPPAPNPNAPRQLKVEDALAYLDQVKAEFAHAPSVYNHFLEIMKQFKMQVIDTPGVIQRVSDLFRGRRSLILGFNTFLPPGYKIECDEDGIASSFVPGSSPPSFPVGVPVPLKDSSPPAFGARARAPAATQPSAAAASTSPVPPQAPSPAPAQQAQAAAATKPKGGIDFDQAISYVTKIKTRFSSTPSTYKAFLEILHTYQKEQTNIRTVYERVASLFADHQDLLEEFKQFLPMTSSQVEKSAAETSRSTTPVQPAAKTGPKGRGAAKADARAASAATAAASVGKEKRGAGKRTSAKRADELIRKQNDEEAEAEAKQKEKAFPYGPSYRTLNIPPVKCTGRTDLGIEVLNDELVSVPAGSEESKDAFKKSQFDEIIFQCEDDRCELDIVIEQNSSTIRFLEPLCERVTAGDSNIALAAKLDLMKDIHRASISRIYGEHGAEALEGLRRNCRASINVVLKRLKQKDEEWRSARVELHKFWKDVYEKNQQKAFESSVQAIKNADRRLLSPKGVATEYEQRMETHHSMHAFVVEPSIHADILLLALRASVNEFEPEEKAQMTKIWKGFVRPFFHAPVSHILRMFDFTTPDESMNAQIDSFFTAQEQNKAPAPDASEGEAVYGPHATVPRFAPVCLPLTDKASSKATSSSLVFRNKEICFANLNVLMLVRVYLMVYERLERALEASMRSASDSPANGRARYNVVLQAMHRHLEGNLEQAKYEEVCRQQLGQAAYHVFTLERPLSYLIRHVNSSMIVDEHTLGLLGLFEREHRRGYHTSLTDAAYLTQASRLVSGDEAPIRIEFTTDTRELSIRAAESTSYMDEEQREAEEKVYSYIETFVNQPSDESSQSLQRVLLRRNMMAKGAPKEHVYENAVINNGLECRICPRTLKMFFTNGSEDFFHRPRVTPQRQQEASRPNREARLSGLLLAAGSPQPLDSLFPAPSSSLR